MEIFMNLLLVSMILSSLYIVISNKELLYDIKIHFYIFLYDNFPLKRGVKKIIINYNLFHTKEDRKKHLHDILKEINFEVIRNDLDIKRINGNVMTQHFVKNHYDISKIEEN
jgi:hypothetical protein